VRQSRARLRTQSLLDEPADQGLLALKSLGLEYQNDVFCCEGVLILNPEGELGNLFFVGHAAVRKKDSVEGIVLGFGDDKADQLIWSDVPADATPDNLVEKLSPRWVFLRDLKPGTVETPTGLSSRKCTMTRDDLLAVAGRLAPAKKAGDRGGARLPACRRRCWAAAATPSGPP
jgi:hypothetical protein